MATNPRVWQMLDELVRSSRMQAFHARRNEQLANEESDVLADQVAELALVVRSLMQYLDEKGQVDTTRFMEIMTALDASDGVVDGKLNPKRPAAKRIHLPKKR